ncbi:MAG: YceI family protein [Saprospiraceae bacterium]|nr:YceI family protein [Saprospiraceae bacterium]
MFTRYAAFILFPLSLILSAMNADTTYFQIEQGSKLQIKGTSNVTDFTCQCLESFPKSQAQITVTEDGTKAKFSKTTLQIRTKKLDCGNKPMNNDMFNTLKAEEYPYVQIELLETRLTPGKSLAKTDIWMPIEASVNFTIAGVTRKETLTIQGKKLDELEYRFKSSKTLLFTDYGIKPPRALMGLVKVANEITIELDLTVTIQGQM